MAGVELRDYQEEAVRRMRNGCILCGGVGSGKSRTSLAYYYVRNGGELGTNEYVPMDDVNIKDLYIITTARKRDTFEWEEELSPFLLSTNKKENLYTNKVVIDSWNNIKKYADVKDAFFIFDEQRVIGSGTWVKIFKKQILQPVVKRRRFFGFLCRCVQLWQCVLPLRFGLLWSSSGLPGWLIKIAGPCAPFIFLKGASNHGRKNL